MSKTEPGNGSVAAGNSDVLASAIFLFLSLMSSVSVMRKCLASLVQSVGFEGRHGNKPRKCKLANKY